jgi:hypothetical protein
MLNVRKLAAIDLQFLGAKLIISEFALGVLGPIALGVFTLRAAFQGFHSSRMVLFGAYLLFLGVNYVPLLILAIGMAHDGSAQQEIADELQDKRAAFRKYRRESLFLLVPLVVPVAAFVQEVRRRRTSQLHSGTGHDRLSS